MTIKEKELVNKVKETVFDSKQRKVCNFPWWCDCDGFCPTYECTSLDKLDLYSDRQWLNAIKAAQVILPNDDDLCFEDLVDEVLIYMKHKQPYKRKYYK